VLVGGNGLQVQNPMAFPNPFDDGGTAFSFLLVAGGPADLLIRVYTTSGRLIYEREERGLSPGYHQLAWEGRDAEGDKLANGVYVYRLLATNGANKAEYLGRLVKLRKPRRAATP
jgi:flagellar hook assembly protein FlgD